MTQRETVLRLLRERGRQGVHTFELRAEFIGNPSQRIAELEADGHLISAARGKLHGRAVGSRYTLVRDAGTQAPLTQPASAGALFDVPAAPGNAIGGEWEDAA